MIILVNLILGWCLVLWAFFHNLFGALVSKVVLWHFFVLFSFFVVILNPRWCKLLIQFSAAAAIGFSCKKYYQSCNWIIREKCQGLPANLYLGRNVFFSLKERKILYILLVFVMNILWYISIQVSVNKIFFLQSVI